MIKRTDVYAEIFKVDKLDDGTLMVHGKATGPDLDSDKQICDPEWLKSAMPDWFKFGNIREQHSSIAAGVGTELTQDGNDWHVSAHVVDPGSVKKVDAKVLKGFSVGISQPRIVKDIAAPGGRIVGGNIVELSLVDRPANPTCLLTLAKSVAGVLTKADPTIVEPDMSGDGTEPDAPDALGPEGDEVDLIVVARDALSQWLASEAAEVAAGTGGTMVVQIICQILCDLDWAADADAYDDAEAALDAVKSVLTTPKEDTVLTLSSFATLTKAAKAADASEDDKTSLIEIRKALGVEELIATEVTKATKPLKETIKSLSAEVVKVGETVLSNGPTRVRTQADAVKASAHDAANAEASHWEAQAATVNDHILRAGYLAKAAAARASTLKE